MKKLVKKNILIFSILVVLPYVAIALYNRSTTNEFTFVLQYIVLTIALLGGLLMILINSKHLKENKKESHIVSVSVIVVGGVVFLFSAFIILLQYSLRNGIGF